MIIRHKWRVVYGVALMGFLFLMLFSKPDYSFWWWFTFICLFGGIITGITYLGYSWLINFVNKYGEDDNG